MARVKKRYISLRDNLQIKRSRKSRRPKFRIGEGAYAHYGEHKGAYYQIKGINHYQKITYVCWNGWDCHVIPEDELLPAIVDLTQL